ncbi:hypothetical protein CSB45_01660 [candidate division KSB3 bacterium]|uniref:Type II secretion system protein GspG C-terminal domain-containing protein n=1 Tax=candidate division KSB3 bacterium TaxID=2044937 RepID=A0A2G6EAR4_9BACT|nr:MAG: hypothetical protein CSB45_01660 [candidate division KSB3 bacterium]PIE30826.1 MAG: hypothetical protein CSA57_01690 [candidate division KSB3 bacterium]
MFRKEKGFTLIELLIVVAIIGIIAAIAVPNLLTAIQRSKQKRTMADMRAIGTALGSYQVDYDTFPVFSNEWTIGTIVPTSYYTGSDIDGWGARYYYKSDGNNYTLSSCGKGNAVSGSDFEADIRFMNGSMYEAGKGDTGACGTKP